MSGETNRPVVIVGAGIAGLAAAIGLEQRGIPVRVFERATAPRAGGGGLLLWANGIRALRSLGLAAEVVNAGGAIEVTEFRTWRGVPMWRLPVARIGRGQGSPSVVVARADLMNILVRAKGPGSIEFGCECTGFSPGEGRVHVELADGRTLEASALLAADGIHSSVRARLLGQEATRSAEQDAWVGIAEGAPVALPPREAIAIVGSGLRFWAASIGRRRIHWYATVSDAALKGGPPVTTPQGLREMFRGAEGPAVALIEATDLGALVRTRVQDRAPVASWTSGRVALMGDAAHPSTPDLGQGACQALEDAACIQGKLPGASSVEAALLGYERERLRRTRRITNLSWAVAIQTARADPFFCGLRDLSLSTFFPRIAEPELAWILRGDG